MSAETTKKEWLSAKEAASILGGVSIKLIYKLFHKKELDGVKVGDAIRIRAASVAAYMEMHSNRKPAAVIPAQAPVPKPARNRRRPKQQGGCYRFLPIGGTPPAVGEG
jgi:excisionase family DNA binding protein